MSMRSAKRAFTLVELLVVIVIISLLAALLLPALIRALCSGRQGTAIAMASQVSDACTMYKGDFSVFPTGDGSGSTTLVTQLKLKNKKKQSYFDFRPDLLKDGHIRNPVWPSDEILYYRNNMTNYPGNEGNPDVHNKQTFDIWGKDCNDVQNGVNNWGG